MPSHHQQNSLNLDVFIELTDIHSKWVRLLDFIPYLLNKVYVMSDCIATLGPLRTTLQFIHSLDHFHKVTGNASFLRSTYFYVFCSS
jgi:hypothetical protein